MIENTFKLLFSVILIFLILEILISALLRIKNFFLIKEKKRKDFLDPKYHKYLRRYESARPIFKYIPIGLRSFNFEDGEIQGVKNNSLGFRCPEFTEKKKNIIRVVLLGGSAAWGSGSSNNGNTITGHLEKILNEKLKLSRKKKIECWNLAQINNYLSQDLLNANLFFEKLRPDFVISYAGWNEMAASYLLDQKKLKKFRTYFMEEVGDVGPMSLPSHRNKLIIKGLSKLLFENSKIISFFQNKNNNKNIFDKKKFKNEMILSSSIFVDHLNKFKLMSKGYSFKYIQFLQPHIYKKNDLTNSEKKITQLYNFVRPVHGGENFEEYLKSNDIYKYVTKDTKIQKELECYNLSEMFANSKEKIYYTLVHLTDRGYKLVAERISQVLLKHIKKLV